MDPNNNFKTFCFHVEKVVILICLLEIAIFIYSFKSEMEHPFEFCQSFNVTELEEISTGRGPSRMHMIEKRICTSNNTFINFFIISHLVSDILCLSSACTYRVTLVVPLLMILAANIICSSIYIFTFLVAHFFFGSVYDGYLVTFICLQLLFRIYEFAITRRYYWYKNFQTSFKLAPVNNLLYEDDYPFQF
uniref:Uncharacterized protein n=1 Tax=Rhabditophanes sp. KR3021 TaxID=114890 RepID=A0AC35UH68_9BILA